MAANLRVGEKRDLGATPSGARVVVRREPGKGWVQETGWADDGPRVARKYSVSLVVDGSPTWSFVYASQGLAGHLGRLLLEGRDPTTFDTLEPVVLPGWDLERA